MTFTSHYLAPFIWLTFKGIANTKVATIWEGGEGWHLGKPRLKLIKVGLNAAAALALLALRLQLCMLQRVQDLHRLNEQLYRPENALDARHAVTNEQPIQG